MLPGIIDYKSEHIRYSFFKLCFPDVLFHCSFLSWILLTILIIASLTKYWVVFNHIIQFFFRTLINMLNSTNLLNLFRLLSWPFPSKNGPLFATLHLTFSFKFARAPIIQFFPFHHCISNNTTPSCTWLMHFLICS